MLSPSSRSEFQEQSAFVVVIDRIVEGGGRVKEARWRGRALWSRRGSLSDAGLAGSGRFVVVLLINLGVAGALSV